MCLLEKKEKEGEEQQRICQRLWEEVSSYCVIYLQIIILLYECVATYEDKYDVLEWVSCLYIHVVYLCLYYQKTVGD